MDFKCSNERPICLRVNRENREDRDRQCGQENNELEYSPLERIKSILTILNDKTGEACPREPKPIETSDDTDEAKEKYEDLQTRYKDCNCYGFDTAWITIMKDIEKNFDEINVVCEE